MRHRSEPGLLALHAVRLRGMVDTAAAAARFGLSRDVTEERLLDAQAFGWVTWSQFAGTGGWSLTERGRGENERQLADELAGSGAAQAVRTTFEEFLPLNGRVRKACTDWQLRPRPGDPLAPNDHSDAGWDREVLHELAEVGSRLVRLDGALSSSLERFAGYAGRFLAALRRVEDGDPSWVDGTGIDSCHTVWFELHEDLLATLGETRR